MKEFTLTEKPELQLRYKQISPIKLLGLQSTINFDDVNKASSFFQFVLENTEVNISGTWLPVKEKDREVYYPQGIEEDLTFLLSICTNFIKEVLQPTFTKSRE